jgi:hypothetical protein
MREVGVEFLETAPYVFRTETVVGHRPERVFQALAADPAGWGSWYPGFSPRGLYLTPAPQGPGSRRRMWMAGARYDETVIAWEEPSLWAFRVDSASLPVARALAERYRVTPVGSGASSVEWTFAVEPGPLLHRAGAALDRFLPVLFNRSMRGLDRRLGR